MSPLLWIGLGGIALLGAWWAYGTREERVPGRTGPAVLRALVIFLVLAGLALPALRGGTVRPPARVVLLDVSRSMELPARPGPDAPSRLDSARAELAALRPDRIYLFGDRARAVHADSVDGLSASDARTRIESALESARLGGADSVWVLTDGDILDREAALEAAGDLGLGVEEIRTAVPVPRVGVASIAAPDRARAGDTVLVAVEIRAGGDVEALPDSVSLELRRDSTVLAAVRVERPAAGRAGRAELPFVPSAPADDVEWQRLEVVVTDPVDPLGAARGAAAWVEISEASGGAVLLSTNPDWEARFIVPSLERLVLGGARGFLRLADGRYLDMSPNPRLVDESVVRRAMSGARLLVVQGEPGALPPWLAQAVSGHPRILFFATGPGRVPGADVNVTGPLPGEWYASPPIPTSPATAFLDPADLDPLPPVRDLYAVDPPGDWSALDAMRNRRGEARPLLVAGQRGSTRWAVSAAPEWWRWALRAGEGRRVYDGTMSGVVGWLVEGATPALVSMAGTPSAGRPLAWRVRAGAGDLGIRILDASGDEVWTREWEAPPASVAGPVLDPGLYETVVTATGPDGAFETRRPVEIFEDARELLPGPSAELARLAPVLVARPAVDIHRPRPLWPFALAILLLCAEWAWRHRIGLR